MPQLNRRIQDSQENDQTIPGEILSSWIQAVRADDVEEVACIMETVGEDIKMYLLKERFPKYKAYPCGHSSCDCYPSYIPLNADYTIHLALTAPSMECLQLFILENKVDILQKDGDGFNIIHSLLIFCFFRRNAQDQYINCYKWLSANIDESVLHILLRDENADGLRPLELAAYLHLFPLFTVIFNTKDIYLVREEIHNFLSYKWYDVTDYENPESKRRGKSPLSIFSLMDHAKLAEPETQRFLCSPLVQNWYKKKSKTLKSETWVILTINALRNIVILFIGSMTIIRDGLFKGENEITLIEGGSLSSANVTNATRDCLPQVLPLSGEMLLLLFLSMHSLVVMIIALSFLLKLKLICRCLCKKAGRKGKSAIDPMLFNYIEILLSICLLTKVALATAGYTQGWVISTNVVHILDILTVFALVWSLTFSIQLTSIGHFALMLQNMLGDITRFAVVFILFHVTFSIAFFMSLTSYGKQCDLGNPGFTSILQSFYGMFSLMLNTVSLREYNADNELNRSLLHFLFFVVVPVMLVNLLIALFSHSVSKVAPYELHILTFQHHTFAIFAEYLALPFFKSHLKRKLKSVYAHENNRLYLVVMVMKHE